MKFDHVIYFPNAQGDPEKTADIDHLAIKDSFILDRPYQLTQPQSTQRPLGRDDFDFFLKFIKPRLPLFVCYAN